MHFSDPKLGNLQLNVMIEYYETVEMDCPGGVKNHINSGKAFKA